MSESSQYHISSKPRHVRLMFLIGEDYSGKQLRKLMEKNLQIWGGRYNPIIPIRKNKISKEYKNLCQYYDPDVILYTPSVDIEKIQQTIQLNPLRFSQIREDLDFTMGEISATYFLNERERNRLPVLSITIPPQLKDYYWLNFLAAEETYKLQLRANKDTFLLDTSSVYSSMNKYLFTQRVQRRSMLSCINLETVLLHPKNASTNSFELVLCAENDSMEDLFYFWNRQLYSPPHVINQIILSVAELRELLKDQKYFGEVVNLMKRNSAIDVTSFSLSDNEVKEVVEKEITPLYTNLYFRPVSRPSFPFEISDSVNYVENGGESIQKQHFHSNKGLYSFPTLSFSNPPPTGGKWAIDIEIDRISEYEKQGMFFSYRTDHKPFLYIEGRINKRRNITIFASSHNSTIEFKIPPFENLIRQILSSPIVSGKKYDTPYKEVAVSNDGIKLSGLINMFKGKLDEMETILYDKFWFDIISKLSSNTKIAGDTISFDEIKSKCITAMNGEGITLNPDSHQNEKNLEAGIRYAIESFCENGIFFVGFNIKCPACTSKFWYSLNESRDIVLCKGCRNKYPFPIEESYAYKLNDLVKSNYCMRDATGRFVPEGNLTVLKSIINLRKSGYFGFEYSPQLNIYADLLPDTKPITDIDIIGLPNGKLILGEAKHSSEAFEAESHKCLHNLIEIAKTILPDQVVISCSEDPNGKLEKKKQYLIHHLAGIPVDVNAIHVTAPYYQFESPLYFYR